MTRTQKGVLALGVLLLTAAMLLTGFLLGTMTNRSALHLAAAITSLGGAALYGLLPKETPGAVILLLLGFVLGGIQYFAGWLV